ncbi:hypothetical protein Q9S71_13375 [Microbacterium sp. KSW4-11]|uniref:Uncharacterized protein n=1 Tax=Microbacterium gawkjiense TaxID=3067309 RepID=A0ABU3GDC8_9MICO|nr:hypothetical protein [Microbacterium sp. KSW4-11]MDT3317812.1 hypothetical protein [Microbacterium sp. KSW4-11]
MATATLSTRSHSVARAGGAASAAVLSVLGTIVAIGIAAIGLLVVPVALLVTFGASLVALF